MLPTQRRDVTQEVLGDEFAALEARDSALQVDGIPQQENLAKRFDVSRQPVRAALQISEEKVLVSRGPDRSVAVLGLPESASNETIAVRRLLEPEALKLAIRKFTDQDMLVARHALERCEIEDDPASLTEHGLDFQMAPYRPCQNQTLIQMIENLRRTSTRAYLGQPPYYAVIFTNQLSDDDVGYEQMGARMFELAVEQPGCIGADSARESDGVGIPVSYWRDEESIVAWKA